LVAQLGYWRRIVVTKTVDSKGRLALGSEFAGKTVILKKTKFGIRIVPAVVVPEHEVWLTKNQAASESIERGLAQARAGEFAPNPPQIN
jgi:hypothetical protein